MLRKPQKGKEFFQIKQIQVLNQTIQVLVVYLAESGHN